MIARLDVLVETKNRRSHEIWSSRRNKKLEGCECMRMHIGLKRSDIWTFSISNCLDKILLPEPLGMAKSL